MLGTWPLPLTRPFQTWGPMRRSSLHRRPAGSGLLSALKYRSARWAFLEQTVLPARGMGVCSTLQLRRLP